MKFQLGTVLEAKDLGINVGDRDPYLSILKANGSKLPEGVSVRAFSYYTEVEPSEEGKEDGIARILNVEDHGVTYSHIAMLTGPFAGYETEQISGLYTTELNYSNLVMPFNITARNVSKNIKRDSEVVVDTNQVDFSGKVTNKFWDGTSSSGIVQLESVKRSLVEVGKDDELEWVTYTRKDGLIIQGLKNDSRVVRSIDLAAGTMPVVVASLELPACDLSLQIPGLSRTFQIITYASIVAQAPLECQHPTGYCNLELGSVVVSYEEK